jgi:hypothetical protein
MKKTYLEKLKDPQWQRKRLEIMNRDGFKCISCHQKDKTLNVHHLYYAALRDPWNYPDWCFKTLCEECHKETHGESESTQLWEEAVSFFAESSEFWQEEFRDIAMEFSRFSKKTRRGEALAKMIHFLNQEDSQ